jgi:AraC-like DNA-binding protein
MESRRAAASARAAGASDNEEMSVATSRLAGPSAAAAAAADEVDEHVAGQPAAALRPLIAGYSGYRQAGLEPAVHLGLPSPFLTLIFTLDDPLDVTAHPDPAQPGARYETLVGGLHTSPALVAHDGRQSGIQVALSPLGARALLGVPAGELASLDCHGTEVLGPLAGEIQQRLRGGSSWPRRFELLSRLLLERAGHRADDPGAWPGAAPGVSRQVRYAWLALLRSGGQVGIAQLAADTGWSDRHLRARFRAEIGLTPKAAARVIRFDRARRQLAGRVTAGAAPDLAGLAADCGFYDQAHLDREFRALAGCPPTTWLAREFRSVQAAPGHLLAG